MPTADEAKKTNIEKMGETLGAQYSALWQEIAYLHMNWNEYVELFGTKPERVEILNKAAPSFFRMLQDELFEVTLLSIARLTDRSKTFGHQGNANLTIWNLPDLVEDAGTKKSVQELIEIAKKETEFCRVWRNKRIAHRDMEHIAIEQKPAKELPEASRAMVKAALKAIADVMNAVENHYCNSGTAYDAGAKTGGAVSLLYVLNTGNEERAARAERLEKGQPLDRDLERKAV